MFFSHRIAGPLYRLTRFFSDAQAMQDEKKVGNAKLKPVFFRQNDFFPEVPGAINNYLKKVDLLQDPEKEDEDQAA